MGHSKNEILGETPLNITWIEGFPCLICKFSICCNLIFVISPDGFNSNLKKFFGATHSHVVQEHPDTNEFCSNARFPFWVYVEFQWEKWVKNLSASSAFRELSPYKQKRSPHSAAPHEFTKVKTLYHENMLSSNLLLRLHAFRTP